MKPSQFNVFFVEDGVNVGYNCLSNSFLLMEPTLYDLYNAAVAGKNFEELEEVHPDFYNNLLEKNFMVKDEIDEVELVKNASYQIDNDDSKFELHINPTMNCNFKCWYCYETHIKDSKMSEETIEKTIKFISNVFENQTNLKYFHLSWFGGEPLLYFHKVMVPILKFTHDEARRRNVEFNSAMTTNGLLIDDKSISICEEYKLNFFQITLDGNRERHDTVRFISEGRGSYDKIVANIFSVLDSKLKVVARINVSNETLEGIMDIADDFSGLTAEQRLYLSFDLHKVWQEGTDIDDQLQETRVKFREMGFTVVSGTHESVANSCYGDHRYHAVLNYNGEAFKCTARDFTHDNSEGLLMENGQVQWGEKYERRLAAKFKNKPCLECKILPICGGGCSQQALEHEGIDYCVNDFDEDKKLQLVKNKFFEILVESE